MWLEQTWDNNIAVVLSYGPFSTEINRMHRSMQGAGDLPENGRYLDHMMKLMARNWQTRRMWCNKTFAIGFRHTWARPEDQFYRQESNWGPPLFWCTTLFHH